MSRLAWNKGKTKETNQSVRNISETMKHRKIDNFAVWRKTKGLVEYPEFKKDGELAELRGVIMGDGSITALARTECLRIVSNSNNPGFVKRYARLVECVIGKKPHVAKRKTSNAINITLYQKNLSKRLQIATSVLGNRHVSLPRWIWRNDEYVLRYLRGLYEAEGSFSTHKKTYTYKFSFSNRNDSLLDHIFKSLLRFGLHPHRSKYQIQISRKKYVFEAMDIIQFRKYE